MRWLIPLLILSTGCGWYPFPYKTGSFVVRAGCIEAHSDFKINQEAFEQDVLHAQIMLDKAGIVKWDDFCNEFQDVPISVSANDRVAGTDFGYYNRLRGILLAHDGSALLHEFIHEVDVTRDYSICSASHCGWKDKGYFILDSDFIKDSFDLRDDRSWKSYSQDPNLVVIDHPHPNKDTNQ